MSHVKRFLHRINRKYGMNVVIRPKVETITGDEVTYSWGTDVSTKAMVTMLTGMEESWDKPGTYVRADALVSFPEETVINTGDLLQIGDDWYQVNQNIKRYNAGKVEWIEALVERRQGV